MNTPLYQFEDFDINENILSIFKYLNSEARNQSLHEIEHSLFNMLLKVGKNLLKQFLEKKATDSKVSFIIKNNETLPFHSTKKCNYLSIFGDIEIKRAYFWKPGSIGEFPMDAQLKIPKHLHSYLLDKWIQKRITVEPYDQAIESIADLLDVKITKRLVQQVTDEASQEVDNYYKQKQNFPEEGSHLIAQIDCKGVIMIPKERPESKLQEEFVRRAKGVSKIGIRKDAVVTLDYSIYPSARTPKDILEGLMTINSNKKVKNSKKNKKLSEARNKQVGGTMFGKEKAIKNLADRLQTRDGKCEKPIYVLMDGAASLEKGITKEFKERGWESRVSGYCLDIVHALEYMWDASTALYGEVNPKRVSWVRYALEKTLDSNINVIIQELEHKIEHDKLTKFTVNRLQRSITYFKNHQHMMDYKKYLRMGFPIASGGIEGACNNLVKDRTDRSGMQWTKKGADAVINLRGVQCNKDWEDYWSYYIEKQSEKLYGQQAA
jgi:hypothetical protein